MPPTSSVQALRLLIRAELQQLESQLKSAFTVTTMSKVETTAGAAEERAVFVLGLPRSGTTLIEQIISSHPKVAAGGELPFWSQAAPAMVRSGAGEDDYATTATAYRAVLAGISPDAARVTDKSVQLLLDWGDQSSTSRRAYRACTAVADRHRTLQLHDIPFGPP